MALRLAGLPFLARPLAIPTVTLCAPLPNHHPHDKPFFSVIKVGFVFWSPKSYYYYWGAYQSINSSIVEDLGLPIGNWSTILGACCMKSIYVG
ncbi:hypothetical protein F4782DRAFT_505097 [Xylaria castorea]|nr:hypothetical protein F4782DRAFT_505097 [Xylaria castorea]